MLIDELTLTNSVSRRKHFVRRKDLTEKIRAHIAVIAYLAQEYRQWGCISAIANEYRVSRPFVYDAVSRMKNSLSMTFGDNPYANDAVNEENEAERILLSLRLEGGCSIHGISTCMKRFGVTNSSVGFISQYLTRVGSLLPATFAGEENTMQLAIFASDEIFSGNTPILVTVDPVSSAILRIELSDTRKAQDWVNHWECIEDNGYTAIYIVSDEGTGLTCGHSRKFSDRPFQPDTWHTISHRLGLWLARLEREAYQAMEREYERLKVFDSAKSENVIARRLADYETAVQETMQSIKIYEDFNYLYSSIIKELHLFDLNGNLRNRRVAEENIEIILDLFDTLNRSSLSDAVGKIRKTLPDLLNYFDQAVSIIESLKQSDLDENALKALCAGWQWHRCLVKSKIVPRRHYCQENELFCLEIAKGYLQEQYNDVKDRVYHELNHVVQSSAMVECINSIIRPYLNTSRNQITREMLNLIMFYHNHRRYKRGERAGKTPYEILTGKEQKKDWLELLFDIIHNSGGPLCNDFIRHDSGQAETDQILTSHRTSDDYAIGIRASR